MSDEPAPEETPTEEPAAEEAPAPEGDAPAEEEAVPAEEDAEPAEIPAWSGEEGELDPRIGRIYPVKPAETCQQLAMETQAVFLVDPDRLAHLASSRNALR